MRLSATNGAAENPWMMSIGSLIFLNSVLYSFLFLLVFLVARYSCYKLTQKHMLILVRSVRAGHRRRDSSCLIRAFFDNNLGLYHRIFFVHIGCSLRDLGLSLRELTIL